ncbi:MAG: hypothetical protein GX811_06835 [Lentisphaerae bacterium]|nr:hypothetical protein [Lentisphaerota bacterium]
MTGFVHQTDIFHPHGDPDDHWDMATVYALAVRGNLDLRGVMFDYPPAHRAGDPATLAMAQLGHLTGITGTPFVIGSMQPLSNRKDTLSGSDERNRAAAEWLCRILEGSREQTVINIVGSCTDVALAGLLRPDLFKSKCRAVYLNAGSAHPGRNGELEYNVRLNPGSFAAIFDLPCPVYWCPCWHQTEVREVGMNGTWYSFAQEDAFAHLSDSLCNFFLYMLNRSDDPKYIRYLHQPVDLRLKSEFGLQHRSMWSTAAILHAADLGVDTRQGLLPAKQVRSPLFDFVPIDVTCADDGQTTWNPSKEATTGRYIFRARDTDVYQHTMTVALARTLTVIGMLNKAEHETW